MGEIKVFFIILVLVIINDFLSKQENPIFGGIFPVGFLVLFLLNFIFEWVDYANPQFAFVSIIGLFLLFGGWAKARKDYQKKLQLDLDKITKKDL